ncbi:hypothetical protein [Nonomuraea sp. NPDC049158]|uniref:hypothetical protein n=1 Tax=Nonomuraea sp. NPDC049158 TaxID=3155649 RepID=UPI0033C3AA09
MATYIRGAGGHVAERVQPAPGSDDATRLEQLADDPESGWRIEDTDTAESEGPFDPSAHDMPIVLAYLQKADLDEAVRVLDAEAADGGKKRKGVLGVRDELLASKKE